jgi:hypothetical protein
MLYRQLTQIRAQLGAREMNVSDALLLVARCLRQKLPGERLLWLNRELLGYRKEDLAGFCDKPRFGGLSALFMGKRNELEVPQYRFLLGAWGRIDGHGKLLCVYEPRLLEKSIFCNIGIQQIETQLDEMEDPGVSLFSMSSDQASGAEFYCWSRELVRVMEAVRAKLCDFIDTVIEELKLAPRER